MHWKQELRLMLRDAAALLEHCGLQASSVPIVSSHFPVSVPKRWLDKIRLQDPCDPLLLQVLARAEEAVHHEGDAMDPLEELDQTPLPGLIQKYPHRALIVTSGACPIHCRYCFRRHFPYGKSSLSRSHRPQLLAWLKEHVDIYEVILSGGDPLMWENQALFELVDDVLSCRHVRRIRIHTRFPSTIPSRFDQDFWQAVTPYAERIIWVWHINHPNELGEDVLAIARKTLGMGMKVLSQSVLLKGINDDVATLQALMWALDAHKIQPYYLHQFDRVQGARHFEVDARQGLALIEALRASLPGDLLPRYVREVPGKLFKVPVERTLEDDHS